MIPELTTVQWAAVALIVAGAVWWLAPSAWGKIKAVWPKPKPFVFEAFDNDSDTFVEMCWRLDSIQVRLEELGHVELAASLDAIYPALRLRHRGEDSE